MDIPATTPITLREAAERHTADLLGLQDLAKGTARNYRVVYNTLRRHLAATLEREPMTTDITIDAVAGYFRDYVAKECASTYGPKRSTLRLIVIWLMRRGYMAPGLNAADELPARRRTQVAKRNRRLTDAQFLLLLKVAKRSHLRDYYLCLFMRLTGRRIGEIVGSNDGAHALVWADIMWDEGVIEWDNNKGRKLGRHMPLTPRIRAVLEAWREHYAKSLGVDDVRPNWKLFPALTPIGRAMKGRPRRRVISPNHRLTNPDKIFRALLEEAGLREGDGDNSHMLRKSFANQRKQTATDQNRGDAWELTQISLDHEDMKTTRIYVDDREDYDRYAAWANATPELDDDAMRSIPELSSLVPSPRPETTKPAPAVADAGRFEEVYTAGQEMATVIPLTSRRRRAALG